MKRLCGMRGARAALTGCKAFPVSAEATPAEAAQILFTQAQAVWPGEVLAELALIILRANHAGRLTLAPVDDGQLALNL